MSDLTFTVPEMTCGHCRAAITEEVGKLPGVTRVDVDLDSKLVTVGVEPGGAGRSAIVAAIDEAGFAVSDA